MKKHTSIVMIVFFFFLSTIVLSQEVMKITYGGRSGKRNRGKFTIKYVLQHNDRIYDIADSTSIIDLNRYKGEVRIGIQCSDLKVGLDNSFSKVRNSNHPKVFYLQAYRSELNNKEYYSYGADTIKIAAQSGHYGKKADQIFYSIGPIEGEKKLLFQIKTRIINGVYDASWNGVLISKTFTFLPKIKPDSEVQLVHTNLSKKSKSRYRTKRISGRSDNTETNTQKDTITIEGTMWSRIENDLVHNNETDLLKDCRAYLNFCDRFMTNDCFHIEDVLFYLAQLTNVEEKTTFIQRYKDQFPAGKYSAQIEKIEKAKIAEEIPVQSIKWGLARIDNDDEVLVANRVIGGKNHITLGFMI